MDLVFIANFLMDLALLLALYHNRRPRRFRLLFAALWGAGGASFFLILRLPPWAPPLLALPLAATMLYIAGPIRSFRALGTDLFLLYIYAFILSGILPFLWQYCRLWLLSVAISYLLLRLFLALGHRRARTGSLTITSGDRRWTMSALIDSGNLLQEPFSHLPVIVVALSALDGHPTLSYPIPYRTIDHESLLLAFRPDTLALDGKPLPPALIAVSPDFKSASDTRALIPEALIRQNGGIS